MAWKKRICTYVQDIPLQSAVLQTSTSIGSPRQSLLSPPQAEEAQTRFLHREPCPHDAEHWLHSPHGSQLPGSTGRRKNTKSMVRFRLGPAVCDMHELNLPSLQWKRAPLQREGREPYLTSNMIGDGKCFSCISNEYLADPSISTSIGDTQRTEILPYQLQTECSVFTLPECLA